VGWRIAGIFGNLLSQAQWKLVAIQTACGSQQPEVDSHFNASALLMMVPAAISQDEQFGGLPADWAQ
jgi:uncharacterized membrane-anchored protein YhcB (DUF1043 family)